MTNLGVGKFVDYYEHILAHSYWYRHESARWIGLILTFTMPILLGKFAGEAYKTITTAPNLISWSVWLPHWPVLVILALWFIGYLITRYTKHISLKSDELYNALVWFCQDINTRKNKRKDIRCTIWIPLGNQLRKPPPRLIQAVHYFPKTSTMFDEKGNRTGKIRKNGKQFRSFKVSRRNNNDLIPIGILGRTTENSISGDEPIVMKESFDARKDFIDHMVNNWNFTDFQAKRLSTDRKSYLCFPMVDKEKNELLGILYFDSCKTRAFDDNFVKNTERYLPRFASIITSL